MRQFMQRYDLLITPTVAIPAFDAHAAGHRPMDAQSFLGWTPFSYPFNLTQQPACTVPCGFTTRASEPNLPGGLGPGQRPHLPRLAQLPIGLQIVGPMFGDALVLRAAHAFAMAHPVATLARPMVPLVTT
jgi:aspartyl-tRNA(Asn)/glutamyl-tRNA(Gln) amidotransferase subunit A